MRWFVGWLAQVAQNRSLGAVWNSPLRVLTRASTVLTLLPISTLVSGYDGGDCCGCTCVSTDVSYVAMTATAGSLASTRAPRASKTTMTSAMTTILSLTTTTICRRAMDTNFHTACRPHVLMPESETVNMTWTTTPRNAVSETCTMHTRALRGGPLRRPAASVIGCMRCQVL